MPSPAFVDIESLICPISEDNTVGCDIRLDSSPSSIYNQIKDARLAARAAERHNLFDGDSNEAMENWTLAEVTWEKILQTTKNKTAQLARNRNREQVPYYTCSVRTSGREPVYDPTPAPKPKELDNDW